MNGAEKGTWAFLAIAAGGAGVKYVTEVETWWIGLIFLVVSGIFVFIREWRKKTLSK